MPSTELELTPHMLIQALGAELAGREEFTGPEPVRQWAGTVCQCLNPARGNTAPDKEALLEAARGAFASMLISDSRDILLMGAWHNPQAFARTLLLMLEGRKRVALNYMEMGKTMQ